MSTALWAVAAKAEATKSNEKKDARIERFMDGVVWSLDRFLLNTLDRVACLVGGRKILVVTVKRKPFADQ
jgi:hypothetical protein